MVVDSEEKFVDFGKYCNLCKHKDLEDFKDPCNECLEHPTATGTEVPVNYKKK